MRAICLLISLMAILPAEPVRAQDQSFPYSLDHRDLLIMPAGIGLAILGNTIASDYREPLTLDEITSFKRSDVNAFDRSATGNWSTRWADQSDEYRGMLFNMTIGVGAYEIIRSRQLGNGAALGVMFLETALLVRGSTFLTKGLVGRRRPIVYNTSFSADRRYGIALSDENDVFHSFFSGDAAAAFALATFTSTVFRDIHGPSTWSKLIWGSTLTLATLTAYARVKAGAHYPSDVIVGAIVGGAIGRLVPVLHRKDSSRRLIPGVQPDRICLTLKF
ncbi:phosphatase PAP2 family protein [Gemmatimonadota bacterium]